MSTNNTNMARSNIIMTVNVNNIVYAALQAILLLLNISIYHLINSNWSVYYKIYFEK